MMPWMIGACTVATSHVCQDRSVRHNVVEGEPGMFPDPIARFMRKVGQLFDRKRKDGDSGASTDEHPAPPPDNEGS
jgi:hypothetical protein